MPDRCERMPPAARRLAAKLARYLPVSDEKIGFDYKMIRLLHGSLLRRPRRISSGTARSPRQQKERLHLANGSAIDRARFWMRL